MGVVRPGQPRRARREEIDPAALALIARHGSQVLATARRFSATLEDAEDAYQRALEILLTRAPTTHEAELVPWLKTVVKHEAFAIRRQRERHTPTTDDGEVAEPPAPEAPTHDQAERYERLRLGAEALRNLKPQEVRCLLLKAEGYSYKEICHITGWTYTKVNRSLTEGRRAFLQRVAGIEGGSECERLAPMVSLLADGELSGDEMRMLRPHLKGCLACRARLREYRDAPERVAALFPAAAVAAGGGSGQLRGLLEALIGATQHKAAATGERLHAAAELAAGQKVAAVAASAAAVAGGGVTVDQLAGADGARPERDPPAEVRQVTTDQEAPPSPPTTPGPQPVPEPSPTPKATPAPEPQPAPAEASPAPDPANEFAPGPASASGASPDPAAREGRGLEARRARGGRGSAGGGGGEFGP